MTLPLGEERIKFSFPKPSGARVIFPSDPNGVTKLIAFPSMAKVPWVEIILGDKAERTR
jgi:hypothetical protein